MDSPHRNTPVELEIYSTRLTSLELNLTSQLNTISNHGEAPVEVQQLQPADGGLAAWRLLWAAFVFEAMLWGEHRPALLLKLTVLNFIQGFPLSFGVFQNYYSQLPEFVGNRYVPVVGTVASAISYLGAPLVTPLIQRYVKYRRQMILIGWPLCILGLIAGSFAKTIEVLILTQGIMYGVGFLIFYYPILTMVDEFWVRRRGLAYGLLCAASGVSGTVMPIVVQALLRRYGYPTTLRAIALTLVISTGPLIPLLKGRLHTTSSTNAFGRDWMFLRNHKFWTYNVSNLLMGLGYFFPSLYLPSYATSIGLSSLQGALLLTIMSLSQVAGQFTFGYLSDLHIPLDLLITLSLLVASTATLAAWGIATSPAPLVVFALFYGFFGAGYTALWARMVTAVSTEPTASQALFSVFCFGKGVGNVLAGPIGAGLVLPMQKNDSGYGHGYAATRYHAVVIFTGVCMSLSALSLGVGAGYRKLRRGV